LHRWLIMQKYSVGDLSRDNDIEAVAAQTLIKAP
jgi:hypothetical protein